MEAVIKVEQTVNVKLLHVIAGVRYWEDATVNGVEDAEGNLIPFREGDTWCPLIDIDNGVVINWPNGTTASVHYKVCDNGRYNLLGENNNIVAFIDGYVPKTMSPAGNGYGDYIKMNIDANGKIDNWAFSITDFIED